MKKRYDYKEIRNKVRSLVKDACYSKNNKFTETAWDYHVIHVVKHGLDLGKKFKADLEVLELAALLHDYAAVLNKKFSEEHHVHSARLAEKILKPLNYPQEKIKHIQTCILNHRGRRKRNHKSIESRILASADAMSHFSQLADIFYLGYGVHKLKTRPGAVWIKGKLDRSWKKIMPEGKAMVKKEHKMAMEILNRAISNKKNKLIDQNILFRYIKK